MSGVDGGAGMSRVGDGVDVRIAMVGGFVRFFVCEGVTASLVFVSLTRETGASKMSVTSPNSFPIFPGARSGFGGAETER